MKRGPNCVAIVNIIVIVITGAIQIVCIIVIRVVAGTQPRQYDKIYALGPIIT